MLENGWALEDAMVKAEGRHGQSNSARSDDGGSTKVAGASSIDNSRSMVVAPVPRRRTGYNLEFEEREEEKNAIDQLMAIFPRVTAKQTRETLSIYDLEGAVDYLLKEGGDGGSGGAPEDAIVKAEDRHGQLNGTAAVNDLLALFPGRMTRREANNILNVYDFEAAVDYFLTESGEGDGGGDPGNAKVKPEENRADEGGSREGEGNGEAPTNDNTGWASTAFCFLGGAVSRLGGIADAA